MTISRALLGSMAAALALGGAAAHAAAEKRAAAAPSAPAPAAVDGRTREQLRQEVTERLRALRALKISEALVLDQATAARLFPLLAKYDERKAQLRSERRDIKRELRAETGAATPNNARLTSAVDRLMANKAKWRAMEEERFREARKLLTPAQQAKLVLLLPRIERGYARKIRESVRDEATARRL